MLDIAAICLVITALLAYLNYRFVGMPTTIGVMAAALVFSLALVGLDALGVAHGLRQYEESLLRSIDFSDVLMQGMLSLLLGMLVSGVTPTAGQGLQLLLREAGGGLLFGLALGYVTFRLLRSVDNYQVEVLLTLAAVTGGYALASRLHVSGPLAMVVAGLIIGNHGCALAMSDTTRRYLDMFWELIHEILNAILFVLIGMEVLLVAFSSREFAAAGVALVVTLLARLLTVGLPVGLLQRTFNLPRGSWKVLTWGGLRGGISVALALCRSRLSVLPRRPLPKSIEYGRCPPGRLACSSMRFYAGPA